MTASAAVPPSVSSTPLPLDAEGLASVCVLCSHNCGLRIDVKGGKIARVRADESNPITKGYVCNKAFSVARYAHHDQRVEHPLRRRPDGAFERIDWDTAIREIAEKLSGIAARHSPRAVGLVGVGGQANHMDGQFALTWLGALGSPWWFNAFAQEKTQHFLVDQWMFDSTPHSWFHPDVERTRFLLLMGSNPRVSNRGHNANDTFKRIAENPDQTLWVVDPRETETTRGADRHLRTKPGSDAYLLLGIAATLATTEGMADAAFVRDRTRDFAVLQQALAQVDVAEMARRCGLETREILETARALASADSAAIMFDLAVEQIPFSTLVSYLIRVVSVLTGNALQPGGNLFFETQSPPEWNPRRFEEAPRSRAAGIRGIRAIGGFPMWSPTLIPEEITTDHPERLRALIVEGANPVLSFSDANAFREAREQLDLLVVIDPAMTETARLADYVLPTPCGYEKWEICGFPRGYPEVYVQLRPPVIPGPAEALPEPEIYVRLAEAMGLVSEPPDELRALAGAGTTPEGAAALFAKVQELASNRAEILFWGYRTLGAELPAPSLVAVWVLALQNAFGRRESVLRSLGDDWKGAEPFALAMELFRRVLAHPEGVEIARAVEPARNFEEHVGWDDKRVRLAPEELLTEIARALDTELPRDPDYPFVLASGLRTQWNANTIQRDPRWRKGRGPHCALHLSPQDAERLGVAEGEGVRIRTRRGAVELPAAVDARLQPGHVWIPNGFGMAYPSGSDGALEVQGANVNELSDAADRDPISGCPHHKYTLCTVEKLAA
jgi:anaerobic selenocysteine-containing dehydrogenase